jgi:DTW domain-containing protein YfiP
MHHASDLAPPTMRYRDLCRACNRSRATCFCKYVNSFKTRAQFLILMHPKEFKRQRTGTGRVTALSLINSTIFVGDNFAEHSALNAVLSDETFYPVLLFPGLDAINLSNQSLPDFARTRRLAVIILDATWASARKMLRLSPNLLALPRISWDPHTPSRFRIKRQPKDFCLSTIEATYQVLEALRQTGYEQLECEHEGLMKTLDAIVKFQMQCEANPDLPSHRIKKTNPAAYDS